MILSDENMGAICAIKHGAPSIAHRLHEVSAISHHILYGNGRLSDIQLLKMNLAEIGKEHAMMVAAAQRVEDEFAGRKPVKAVDEQVAA